MDFFLTILAWLLMADGSFGLAMAKPVSSWLAVKNKEEPAAPRLPPSAIRWAGGIEFAIGFALLYALRT